MGSAITILLPATHALNNGKVVGNGSGLNNCICCDRSCCNSCSKSISSILTEANPPPLAPSNEQ